MTDFDTLVSNSKFDMPTHLNSVAHLGRDSPTLQASIVEHAKSTSIVVHDTILSLLQEFLDLKRAEGSSVDKAVYEGMDVQDFIRRLIRQRPKSFVGPSDTTLLRNGVRANGMHWLSVGTDHEESIHLVDYLSYDEMQLSALLGVSSPTLFINNGSRYNEAKPGQPGTFQHDGIYIGLVGARFEHLDKMDSLYMIKSAREQSKLDHMWNRFYGIDSTSTWTRLSNGIQFNIAAYKKRVSIPIQLLLLEAERRALALNRYAYVHLVGLGLGAWQITDEQQYWFAENVVESIKELKLPHVGVVDFSWFDKDLPAKLDYPRTGEYANGNRIKLVFSRREPAALLTGDDADKLVVASYAWDGNSFAGNEYWMGSLSGSGDPAAVCCSTIGELQNPWINPWMTIQVLKS
ncbi:hypothetical protein SmJEL517_g03345 [Synchytrium microbalum]|uniref:Uncharacterized protein n=1 Tax=Synchytrium microbalum TaxID=1806994 RepID=A0A507BWV0_9FUNG|nr:uncharacterized protein SmJEL517_g03345 [Synchytrium microbalum]TPX33820.1 hypothetical protein SmJEL517_g03345 [Synchytrium microbalum]